MTWNIILSADADTGQGSAGADKDLADADTTLFIRAGIQL
jgi:hypothetical protein